LRRVQARERLEQHVEALLGHEPTDRGPVRARIRMGPTVYEDPGLDPVRHDADAGRDLWSERARGRGERARAGDHARRAPERGAERARVGGEAAAGLAALEA